MAQENEIAAADPPHEVALGLIDIAVPRNIEPAVNDLDNDIPFFFGFLRHRSFQARNAFAPVSDPPFTRAQYGATFGGPIKKDRTFFFAAFEQRRRQESGFFTSNVGAGLNASVTIPAGILPVAQTFTNLTAAQATFIGGELASADPARSWSITLSLTARACRPRPSGAATKRGAGCI